MAYDSSPLMDKATNIFYQMGGGMNLDVNSFDSQSLVAAREGDVIWSLPKDIELMARAALGYDLINDTTFVGSNFQGGGAAIF